MASSVRALMAGLSVISLILLVAACDSTALAPATLGPVTATKVSAAQAVPMLEERTVVDVRTPEEFAEGHLVGAVNIPVEAEDFEERVSGLDPSQAYLVYCRSGRRSAMAADIMGQAGLDVVDAGGLQQLVAAGAPLG